ncbi:MAG: hypothetical protein KDK24_04845 [Pseudooceanicola sp.]|nr:hypothetical protein [Pseudooceanicola sp.]
MAKSDIPNYYDKKRKYAKAFPLWMKAAAEREKMVVEARDRLLEIKDIAETVETDLVKAEAKMKVPRRVVKSHAAAAKQLVSQAQRAMAQLDVGGFMAAVAELQAVRSAFNQAVEDASKLNSGHDVVTPQDVSRIKAVKIGAK